MSKEHWSEFWAQGNVTSLPFDYELNYDNEIAAFWNGQFELLNDNAQILDLCSGNGAIALLAAKYSQEHDKNFSIVATDAAKINFEAMTRRYSLLADLVKNITIKDEVLLEDLELNQSFDLITSQYGLEYTDSAKIKGKLDLWLKDNGKIALVCHAQTSDIKERMNREKLEYSVLDGIQFYSRVKKLIRNSASQKELAPVFKEARAELSKTLLTRTSPILQPIIQACQFVLTATPEQYKAGKINLKRFIVQLVSAYARLKDLFKVHNQFAREDWYKFYFSDQVELLKTGAIFHKQQYEVGKFFLFEKK